jgi:hypothetical protein
MCRCSHPIKRDVRHLRRSLFAVMLIFRLDLCMIQRSEMRLAAVTSGSIAICC